MPAKKATETVSIKKIQSKKFTIRIVGDAPLIVHSWDEKQKKKILDAQTDEPTIKGKKEPKEPVRDFIESLYWICGKPTEYTEEAFTKAVANGARFGFPITSFKKAGNAAAYRLGWVKNQTSLRGVYYINGEYNEKGEELVEIHGVPIMREDMVRINNGSADIRYRGEFKEWYADLNVSFIKDGIYSVEDIVNVLNAGGAFCGIGEWRPEKGGQFGRYHIEAK